MNRIYFYKLTNDDGGAPCVQDSRLSLAICKPMLRSTADKNDYVIGFAANNLSPSNPVVYAAKVTEKLKGGSYYTSKEHTKRADCIYEKVGSRFQPKANARYHGTEEALTHDIGSHTKYVRANVILSDDFRFFGKLQPINYGHYAAIRNAVDRLGQGHRINHSDKLERELWAFIDELWGIPQCTKIVHWDEPSNSTCHYDSTCRSIKICTPRC